MVPRRCVMISANHPPAPETTVPHHSSHFNRLRPRSSGNIVACTGRSGGTFGGAFSGGGAGSLNRILRSPGCTNTSSSTLAIESMTTPTRHQPSPERTSAGATGGAGGTHRSCEVHHRGCAPRGGRVYTQRAYGELH